MKTLRLMFWIWAMCLLMAHPATCATASLSLIGTLATPETAFQQTFTLSATSTLRIVTWSFGGGTNAAGQIIPPGGFDPLVALFSGPPATASIFLSGGNPAVDADTLSGFVGNCPPAGTVTIGTGTGSVVCGDDALVLTGVPAGTYTLVVSDANYIPFAVSPGPPTSTLLSDGFLDFTGGVFQTCNTTPNGTTCITPTNHFAVDIVDVSGAFLLVMPPGISKSFGVPSVPLNGSTSLTFNISNPNAVDALTGVGFTDMLPPGLVVATPNGLVNQCGGTATATAGSNSVILANGSVAAGGSCAVSINVTGTTAGTKDNVSGAVTSIQGGSGGPATATLTVLEPPTISKSFADSQIQLFGPGNTTALTFTITNPADNPIPLTDIEFTDTLPSGLIVAKPSGLTGSCGGGTITATAGTNSISLSPGATLAAGASCTFSVNVSGIAIGVQVNTTSDITALGGTIVGEEATATVAVNDLFFIWFFSEGGGGHP